MNDSTASSMPASAARRSRGVGAVGIGLAIVVAGFLDGRYVAFLNSKPAFFARIDVVLVVAGTIVAGLVLAWLVGRFVRLPVRAPTGTRVALVFVGGLLAFGFGAGMVTAGATGAVYHEPVVTEIVGKVAVDLADIEDYVSEGDAPAVCLSVADGSAIESIIAESVGSIGSSTLQTSIFLDVATHTVLSVGLSIDAAEIGQIGAQPTWTGPFVVDSIDGDGGSGRVRFDALRLVEDPPPAVPSNGKPWPSAIAGSIRWICNEGGTDLE